TARSRDQVWRQHIEFVSVNRLLSVVRDQDGSAPELSEQTIAYNRKERPEMFINLVARLNLKHDQRRVSREEIVTTGENAVLLALRIDLDKIRRRPLRVASSLSRLVMCPISPAPLSPSA